MDAVTECRCIIVPECLALVRRHWMVSLEAISGYGYSRDYLEALECGEGDDCVDQAIVHAYQLAAGRPLDIGLFEVADQLITSVWRTQESLRRLSKEDLA